MVIVEDMLGKVRNLRYVNHDVTDVAKLPALAQENYLEAKGEIRPLGKLILEPMQWIIGLYNLGIMNLLDIPHFKCGKKISFCVKQLLARIHGGITWMDRLVPIDFDLIDKIIGLPTSGAQPEEYLENKSREKEIAEEVKAVWNK
jgi:hypothetical protein